MLARIVEVAIKGGKKQEVFDILQNELIPFVQKQPGFVASEGFSRESDPNYTISTTYWQSKQDAENCYSASFYSSVLSKLRPLLASDVRPVYCNVEYSTTHRISLGKAA